MTTGIVLIVAILVLGGVIATVGDRIGMRVGKARLSLFNLRPRQTATIISVLTGIIISASTFGILFAIDDQLRTGVFELREIQENLSTAREQLDEARGERRQIQRELNRSLAEQRAAERRLARINRSLRRALAQQERTEAQLNTTQSRLNQIATNYRQAQTLLGTVSRQAASLRSEIGQLEADRQQQIAARDRELAERGRELEARNRDIAQRNRAIVERENQLRELEAQRAFLDQEVQTLVREFQNLRQGNVALLRNQVLASGIVRVVTPSAAPRAVDQLLRQANQLVVQRIRPSTTSPNGTQVIQITRASVEQLIDEIDDGRDYVVRILSAGNYIVGEPCALAGEPCIQIFADAALNRVVFNAGESLAATSVDPATLDDERLVDRLNLLIAAAQFRSRQAGIVADRIIIADDRTELVVNFLEQVRQHNQPLEIQAIAANVIYTAGPVRLDLAAVQNGQVLFTTSQPEASSSPEE